MAALQPAALLRRATTACSAVQLQRRVHGLPLLGLPARPGVEQGPCGGDERPLDPPPEPDRALRPGRLQGHARPDAEPRPALGLHLAARREGQPPVELRRGASVRQRHRRQTFAEDGSIEDRALYKPYYNGWEPRVGVAWSVTDRLVLRGGYGISQFMEGTGANLRLPLNPPFFFESNATYDRTTGAGTITTGFAGARPARQLTGNVRAYDPEPAPAVHPAVERVRRVPADLVHVGAGGLRRPPRHPPRDPDRGQPGAARRGRPVDVGVHQHAPAALRGAAAHHRTSRRRRRAAAATTTPSRRASASASGTASSSWRRTPSARRSPTTSATTAAAGVDTEGAYWMNTYDPEAELRPRRSTTSATTSSSPANYELPWGKGTKWGSEWSG